jgi:hypothetical protein
MARPKQHVKFDADDRTIVEYFDLSMELRSNQKSVSGEISDLNSQMAEAGVDPGTLSTCRKLAALPAGKRGVSVALLHRYLGVLAARLEDPAVASEQEGRRTENKDDETAKASTVSFAKSAAA